MRMKDMKGYIKGLEERNQKLEKQLDILTDKLLQIISENQEFKRELERRE